MSKLHQAYEDARRLREIVTVFFEAGFSRYVDALRLRYLVPVTLRLKRSIMPAAERERLERPPPVRVREALEKLGPTFVKFGQMLSLRADLVGEDYAREFARLQEDVRPISFGQAAEVIEASLGKKIAKAFVTFERKPVAAASLAQVHRATLSGQRAVAVKVERPGIRAVIERDLHLMLLIAHLLERGAPALAAYQPVGLIKEFMDWTLRELDFTVEAANIDRFRVNFAEVEEVKIPAVIWTHTSERVLTMERIEGRRLAQFLSEKTAKISRRVIAEIAVRTMLKMYFADGFFHADPHPGNLMVLPGPRLALLDFGMVGYLDSETRGELISCFMSYLSRDVDSFIKHILELAEPGHGARVGAFKRETQGILDRLIYQPVRRKKLARAFYQIINLGAAHDIRFKTDLLLLARSMVTMEAVALRLDPELDFDAQLRPIIISTLAGQVSLSKTVANLRSNAFDYLQALRSLPERTIALMRKLETGEVGVKLNLEELRDLKEEFDRENDIRIISLVAAALFVGSAIFIQIGAEHALWGFPVGHLALLTSLSLFLWTAFLVMHRPRGS